MAGLAPPQNIRLNQNPPDTPLPPGISVNIATDNDNAADVPNVDATGNILSIDHPDGSITVSLGGKNLGNINPPRDEKWFANLVDQIDDNELGRIANDLLRGIRDDIQSRQEWIEDREQGLRLLGLKVEIPGTQGEASGAPVEGMSKVRHPLLLEAVLRFQANARSELLPTDGPVKIRNDDDNADLAEDQEANALQRDLNHYLTSTASEYYPDTDRMLLMLGFGGTAFKKVHFCPLRNRPVSETVDADDLIVSAQATDIKNARRVTHRVFMAPSTVRRLQILEVYRDISLSTPNAPQLDQLDRAKASQQGVNPEASNPEDRDREIYECYCELEIRGFEHKLAGKETGLEIPYRVTLDVTSQQILSIVRNYDRPDAVDKSKLLNSAAVPGHNGAPPLEQLPEKRTVFVKYTFVPGFGFYDIGLLHILGNTTNALTAAWREMLDNGMFANFPGFLIAKSATRQNTNILRVAPGSGVQVDTNGMDIGKAIMPLPYGTSHMPALQALASEMAETGQRVGGTSEQQVGEGRADAPVGTTLALIDQATKILNSVHKRMHTAQAEEFSLLVQVFREHPESFWQRKGASGYPWDEANFLKALDDYDLVPQADPNTASHSQRVMKVMGLKQLQGANPDLYDAEAVDTAALQALGWSNPSQFLKKGPKQTPPEILKGMAEIEDAKKRTENDGVRAQASMISAQANAEKAKQGGLAAGAGMSEIDQAKLAQEQEKLGLDKDRLKFDGAELMANMENEDKDRAADHHMEVLRLAHEVLSKTGDMDAGNEAERIDKETE